MFSLLKEKHREWSLKLQEKIDSLRSQNPTNSKIIELETLLRDTDICIVRLGSGYETKNAIEKIGLEMQKSSGDTIAADTHDQFISVISAFNIPVGSVGYLIFSTFWANFNLDDRIKILHNVINNPYLQNILEYKDPVTEVRVAELMLPTSACRQHENMNPDIFNFLLPKSTNLDVVNKEGDTALSVMVKQNIPSNVKKLLEKGASLSAGQKDLWFELLNNFPIQTFILDEFDMPSDSSGLWINGQLHVYYDQGYTMIQNLQMESKFYTNIRSSDGYFIGADNAMKIVKLLSSYGLNINEYVVNPAGDQFTLFDAFCRISYGALENTWMLKELIDIPGFNLNFQDVNGITPFMVACARNNSFANVLANQENFNPYLVSNNGCGPIHYLSKLSDINLAKGLLDVLVAKGADINLISCDTMSSTPLSLFLEAGKEELVEYALIKYNVDPSIPRGDGYYLVHVAAGLAGVRMMELLASRGANLNQESSGLQKHNPLMLAQKYCNIKVEEYLSNYLHQNNLSTDTVLSKIYMEQKYKFLTCNKEIVNGTNNWKYYYEKGMIFHKLENDNYALANYDKAIELAPGASEAFARKATILSRLKRFDEALDYANQAIDLNQDNDEVYNVKGLCLRNLRKFEEALSYFERAISMNKYESGYYCNAGCTLLDLCRFDEALKCFDVAISQDPGNSMYYEHKGDALIGVGLIQEAQDCYDIARRELPNVRTYIGAANIMKMSSNLARNNQDLILKVQELQALSMEAIRVVSTLDPEDPRRAAVNEANIEAKKSITNAFTEGKSENDSIAELHSMVMLLQTRLNELGSKVSKIDDNLRESIAQYTSSEVSNLQKQIDELKAKNEDGNNPTKLIELESRIDQLHQRQNDFEEIIKLSNEYNKEAIDMLEQKFNDNQQKEILNLAKIKDDFIEYQERLHSQEEKIFSLEKGLASRSLSHDELEDLKTRLAQYYDEMIEIKGSAVDAMAVIKKLEPLCLEISGYLSKLEESKADLQSIFNDSYKIEFFNELIKQLNVAYLASSVVQSDIVSSDKSGLLGNAGNMIKFIGAYVPVVGFAVQLIGSVLSKIDNAQQKIIIKNLFDVANGPIDFHDIVHKMAIELLKHEDMNEILDYTKLENKQTVAKTVQKVFLGIVKNIFYNVKEISGFLHEDGSGKGKMAADQLVKLFQDEINSFIINPQEGTNILRLDASSHAGIISSVLICKIYGGDISHIYDINDNMQKAVLLLDLVLDEYGLFSQEIIAESEKVAIASVEKYKEISGLSLDYSESDKDLAREISEVLLQKACYRKLLVESIKAPDLVSYIAINIATKFAAQKEDFLQGNIFDMIDRVVNHSDFTKYLPTISSFDSTGSDLDTNSTTPLLGNNDLIT